MGAVLGLEIGIPVGTVLDVSLVPPGGVGYGPGEITQDGSNVGANKDNLTVRNKWIRGLPNAGI